MGFGAKTNPGAAARMLSTETTMVCHRPHRLSIHNLACPKRTDLLLLEDLGFLGEVRIRRGVSLVPQAPHLE